MTKTHKDILAIGLSVIVSFAFVAISVQAATTISTNIDTGGTLSVTGNSTLTGTLGVTGNSTLTSADIGGGYSAGGSGTTISAAGVLQTNGNFNVNGFATTTASNGNIATEGSLTIGGTGTAISRHISSTASLNFAIIGANSCQTATMTVTGAADGDTVSLGVPTALAAASSTLSIDGYVSAADTVTVRICQVAALATSDPAAATVRADVWKH